MTTNGSVRDHYYFYCVLFLDTWREYKKIKIQKFSIINFIISFVFFWLQCCKVLILLFIFICFLLSSCPCASLLYVRDVGLKPLIFTTEYFHVVQIIRNRVPVYYIHLIHWCLLYLKKNLFCWIYLKICIAK